MYNTGLKTTKTFLSCGCEIYEQNSKYHIKHCPLHKSAPQLLKACNILADCGVVDEDNPNRIVERIMPSSSDILFAKQVIAEAR